MSKAILSDSTTLIPAAAETSRERARKSQVPHGGISTAGALVTRSLVIVSRLARRQHGVMCKAGDSIRPAQEARQRFMSHTQPCPISA
jgi:hypothetical protein